MGDEKGMIELVDDIDVILSHVEKRTKIAPTAKYLSIAISVAKRASQLEKKAGKLPNVYVSEKLKLIQEAIEKYKEALEYLLMAIYGGEDALIKLEELKRTIGSSASLRTKIIMALAIHGEMRVKDLADILGVYESAVSRSLKYLIEAGYIERGENGLKLREGVLDKFLEVFDSAYNRMEEELWA